MSENRDFDYESIPTGYYDHVFHRRRGAQSKWHHMKFERIRDAMRGACHLDIGCGPGTFIGTLPEHGFSLGVDISHVQLRYARKAYGSDNRRFIAISGGGLPFADNSFDCITLVELIEHLTENDAEQALAEAYRVLRPGGRVVLSTPNYRSLWPLIEAILNRLGDVDYSDQHINRFNRYRLAKVMKDAGFQPAEITAYQFLASFAATLGWRIADFVARMEPRWLVDRVGLLLLGVGIKPGVS